MISASKRFWTDEEIAIVRRDYRRIPANQIAAALNRTASQVYQKAAALGLASQMVYLPDDQVQAAIERLNAEGYPDSEIARELQAQAGIGVDRHRVSDLRKAMGLPDNTFSDRRRQCVAEKTREQLAAAGLDSLAELRVQAFRQFAERMGWPGDLWPRAVQILTVLYEQGPMTRRQIAVAIGRLDPEQAQAVTNQRLNKLFLANSRKGDKGGDNSYFGELIARGFLVSRKRAAKVSGKGRSQDVYFIPLGIKRGEPATWPVPNDPS